MTSASINAQLAEAAALRSRGRVGEAIAIYERVLSQHPALPDTWYNLALLRRRSGDYQLALAAYDEALNCSVRTPEEVHLNKAVILSDDLRRADEARRELQTALQLNPAYIPALLNLGNLAEDLGDTGDAVAAYEHVLSVSPKHAAALSRLAGMGRRWTDDETAIARLSEALDAPNLAHQDRASLLFALAQRLDAARRFDEAFITAARARQASLEAAGNGVPRHDREAMESRVAMQRSTFTAPEPHANQMRSPSPVFIVGMFRSGSSLLEQILSAHESVQSAGELPLIPSIARMLRPYPAVVASASRSQLDELADVYMKEIQKVFSEAAVVTDKRPDNFEHVGLIKRMFPGARILHTRRHPLDICVSTHFLHIDTSLSWTHTVVDVAHQAVQCAHMMDHWLEIYPDDILTVDYERLLAEPEAQVRAVLSFLGLPWSDACLAFHTARTQVRTASVWQVREPLYQRSIGRWRNYTAQLTEAATLLRNAGLLDDHV